MRLHSLCRWILAGFVLFLSTTPLAGVGAGESSFSPERLREWLGRKIDVDYRACDPKGCIPVRKATLLTVTEEAVTVSVNDSPYYVPKYMIEAVRLSE
jgi:hypothetical protein